VKISLPGRRSGDLIDNRGASSGLGGGGMPIPLPLGVGGGLGGLIILILVVVLNGSNLLGGGGGTTAPVAGTNASQNETVNFVSFVLDDVQSSWAKRFQQSGMTYRPAKLELFTNSTRSGCGAASASTGPFYCPADHIAYLDLSFFQELQLRFGAPGDFAQAYVIAHELGHHVQRLLGISDQVQQESQTDPSRANDLSIRLELQADCYAGVWGHSTDQRGILEAGDLNEGLAAAASVGDDRIQKQASGRINRETWTHGSSDQRVRWFRLGFDGGDPKNCDTFGASSL